MKNLKISTKFFISHASLGLVIIAIISFTFYSLLRKALIQRTIDQLSSINILKKEQVDDHFQRSEKDIEALQIENEFFKLHQAFTKHDHENERLVEKEISELLTLYDFKSLTLLDTARNLVFSSTQEILPTRLIEKIDSLIKAKQNALQIIDASPYSPPGNTVIFYYAPVLASHRIIGAVLIQENFQKIQRILLETTGMGSTGESYLVADDFRMRSASRFFPDTPPLSIKVETDAVKKSSQDLPVDHIITDYRNEKVLSFSRPIDCNDLKWSIISEIDFSEAMEPILLLRNYVITITALAVVITLLITFFLSRAIARPILQLKNIIELLSKGIIPMLKVPATTTYEIIQISEAINQLTEGLKRTSKFANEIGSGNFKTTFETLGDQDTLGLALLQMRDELKKFNERVIRLERERATALLQGQENERKRIIADLHDGVGQLLTAIRMRVDMLDAPSKEEIKSQINEVITEVKKISYNVMPHALVDYGLEAALKGLCDNVKKYTPLEIDFTYVKEYPRKLDFEMSIAIFRIVQEGLNNIVKHAKATHVNLHLLEKEDEIYLILEDNGRGFSESEITRKDGLGLLNIKERAKLLYGSAEIHSTAGIGTTVEVHIPIPSTAENVV